MNIRARRREDVDLGERLADGLRVGVDLARVPEVVGDDAGLAEPRNAVVTALVARPVADGPHGASDGRWRRGGGEFVPAFGKPGMPFICYPSQPATLPRVTNK